MEKEGRLICGAGILRTSLDIIVIFPCCFLQLEKSTVLTTSPGLRSPTHVATAILTAMAPVRSEVPLTSQPAL